MAEGISLADAEKAPIEKPPAEVKPPSGIDPFTGRDERLLSQHLGRVGGFIGGGPEKAGNIAYIVVICSLVMLVLGSIFSAYAASEKLAAVFDKVVTGSFGLITGALGYLFGSSDKPK